MWIQSKINTRVLYLANLDLKAMDYRFTLHPLAEIGKTQLMQPSDEYIEKAALLIYLLTNCKG